MVEKTIEELLELINSKKVTSEELVKESIDKELNGKYINNPSLYEFEIMILFAISVIPFDWIRKLMFKRKNGNISV